MRSLMGALLCAAAGAATAAHAQPGASAALGVSATVVAACALAAPPRAPAFNALEQVSVNCTSGAAYRLDQGAGPVGVSGRAVAPRRDRSAGSDVVVVTITF